MNEYISWIINGLLGVIMYFLQTAHSNLREDLKQIRDDHEKLKAQATPKEAFSDFKKEFWDLFDRLEQAKVRKNP